jgi:hypothetical protein
LQRALEVFNLSLEPWLQVIRHDFRIGFIKLREFVILAATLQEFIEVHVSLSSLRVGSCHAFKILLLGEVTNLPRTLALVVSLGVGRYAVVWVLGSMREQLAIRLGCLDWRVFALRILALVG